MALKGPWKFKLTMNHMPWVNEIDDPPVMFGVKEIKSRVSHVCCECLELIPKGDTYISIEGQWDGEYRHFNTCLSCRNAQQIAESRCSNFRPEYTRLWDCIEEHGVLEHVAWEMHDENE